MRNNITYFTTIFLVHSGLMFFRWHEVKISLGKLKENFRVQLAFGALEKSAWIAVDNITLSYDCEEGKYLCDLNRNDWESVL